MNTHTQQKYYKYINELKKNSNYMVKLKSKQAKQKKI